MHQQSRLAHFLLEQLCFGSLDATLIQTIAAAAVDVHRGTESGDPRSPPNLVRLAEPGSSGLNPQHCLHQMMAMMARMCLHAPRTLLFDIPQKLLRPKNAEGSIPPLPRAMRSRILSIGFA